MKHKNGPKWTKFNRSERCRSNGPKWTEVNRIDQSGPNRTDLICFLSYEEEKLNLTYDNLDHGFEMQMTTHVAWGVPYIVCILQPGAVNLERPFIKTQFKVKRCNIPRKKKFINQRIAHKQPPLPPIHKWYSMPVNYQVVLIKSEQSTTEELLSPKDCFIRKVPHPKRKNCNDKENNVTYIHNSSQINKYINLWNKTGMLKTWSQLAWTQMAFLLP